MPERLECRAEPVATRLSVGVCWLEYRPGPRPGSFAEKGGTYDAMSGDCAVIADTLKMMVWWI